MQPGHEEGNHHIPLSPRGQGTSPAKGNHQMEGGDIIRRGDTLRIREGCRKKCGKSMVFYQTGGWGGSPRVIKNQTPFLEKYFFSELVESF